ncbi:MAG: hypothetical protein ACJ77U_03465, partial [Chloroflexota bacterium]
MARAKRTERAEARRRYRAATAPEMTDDGLDLGATSTTNVNPSKTRSSGSATQKSATTAPT